jgi:hypothetical protein
MHRNIVRRRSAERCSSDVECQLNSRVNWRRRSTDQVTSNHSGSCASTAAVVDVVSHERVVGERRALDANQPIWIVEHVLTSCVRWRRTSSRKAATAPRRTSHARAREWMDRPRLRRVLGRPKIHPNVLREQLPRIVQGVCPRHTRLQSRVRPTDLGTTGLTLFSSESTRGSTFIFRRRSGRGSRHPSGDPSARRPS